MTVVGRLLKPLVKSNTEYAVVDKETAGPASYATGGFSVTIGEVEKVDGAIAVIEDDNTPYKVGALPSGNTVTVKVYELKADTSTGAISTSEVAAGTDLSGVTFRVVAYGY